MGTPRCGASTSGRRRVVCPVRWEPPSLTAPSSPRINGTVDARDWVEKKSIVLGQTVKLDELSAGKRWRYRKRGSNKGLSARVAADLGPFARRPARLRSRS